METMCRVLLGRAEATGNGCGQTVVLEREGLQEEDKRRRAGKKNGTLNLNDLPM